jgi:carboxymethylenebutenolidase
MKLRVAALAVSMTIVAGTAIWPPAAVAQQPGRGEGRRGDGRGGDGRGGRGGGGGLAAKNPDLPSGAFTASSTLAHTMLRYEWVDIPMSGGKLHTWIEYPSGEDRAPVVLVMSHEAGLDDWMRAVADQLATQGFIAVAPDLLSGKGPSGGNFDSFKLQADVIHAIARLSQDDVLRRYKAAFDYGVKLPRSRGKAAALGVGMGGADSFRFAADSPNLDAAVSFYGIAPDETVLEKIRAPLAGFYGEDDPRVMSTVRAAENAMKRLGKTYDVHVYPGATQAFLRSTVEGQNGAAGAMAWPAAIQFLQQHLN